jgi:signal transduction histidine kinase
MRKEKTTDKKQKRRRLKHRSFLILMVSLILIASIAIVSVGSWLLISTGVVSSESLNDSGYIILLFIAVCIVIAISLSILVGKLIIKPVNVLMKGLNELSNGNFKTQIKMSSHEEFNKLSDSFNTLAKELSQTEIMRSDFINNFSHEFKTPLVSIR